MRAARRQSRVRVVNAFDYSAAFERLEERIVLSTIVWDGGPTGEGADWNDPVNWAGDVLPGPADDAVLGSTGSDPVISLTAATSVNSVTSDRELSISAMLTIADSSTFNEPVSLSSTLTGDGDATFNDSLDWESGTMSGTGVASVSEGVTMTFDTGLVRSLARDFELAGTFEFEDGQMNVNDSTFTILATGVMNVSDSSFVFVAAGGSPQVVNDGVVNKLTASASTFTNNASIEFVNNGTVDVQAGALTVNATDHNGDLDVAAGATLTLANTFDYDAASSLTTTGDVNFNGGTHDIPTGVFVPSGVVSFLSGTVTIPDTITPSGVVTISGTAIFNANQTFADVVLTGTMGGTGDFLFTNTLEWNSGTMSGTGVATVSEGVTMTFDTGLVRSLARDFELAGTFEFENGQMNVNDSTFTVLATGVMNVSDSSFVFVAAGGSPQVVNNGTMNKITSSTTSLTNNANIAFVNNGVFDIQEGLVSVGDFTQTAAGNLIVRFSSDSDPVPLAASGDVSLDGAVDVRLIDGYVQAKGDSNDIVTGSSLTGAFASTSFAGMAPPGDKYLVGYTANSARLLTTDLADVNNDLELNILDFVAFQALFVAGDLEADVNGDGVLNILDFITFQVLFNDG